MYRYIDVYIYIYICIYHIYTIKSCIGNNVIHHFYC